MAPSEDDGLIVGDPLTVRQRQLVLASLVGFGMLYLAAGIALGTPPKASDTGAVVVAWFQHNGGHIRTWSWLLTVGLPLFAVFAALIRRVLLPVYRDVFFFGAIAFVVEIAVQGWIWSGLALHARHLEPATARTLLDVASYWGPVLISATVMTLAPVALLALGERAGLPRWLGIVTLVALVEQLVETITLFGSHGFIEPGGPMNLFVGAGLTALAWLSLAVAVSRPSRGGTAAPVAQSPIGA